MSPAEFIAAFQDRMGPTYEVAIHPVSRDEPQFDVFPFPREFDPKGNEYRATFSIQSVNLGAVAANDEVMAEYAGAVAANIAVQRARKRAAPQWNG